jgi:transposase InsO family protein
MAHPNARLGPAGRRELVRLMVEQKMSERQAAACVSVSVATAHRWRRRWLVASLEDRHSGAWTADRSCRPHRSPRRTPELVEQAVCAARRRTGWGPRLIAGETGVAHSTVHAILRRHGCSRAPRAPRPAYRRYEWPCPGDLVHVDVKRYARFARPGHAVTGDRRKTHRDKLAGRGYEFFHAAVDDHSRLAYGELLADETAATTTAFFQRALAWFAEHGIAVARVMTDGAWSYTHNRTLRQLLATHGVRHIVTPPYTPRWNGKVERFHQTMDREWGRGVRYRSSTARAHALPHWLHHYNHHQPHSALDGHAPATRAYNVSGHVS